VKIDYSEFFQHLKATPLEAWIDPLPEKIVQGLHPDRHGLMPQWEKALAQLPTTGNSSVNLKDEVRVEGEKIQGLEKQLKFFHPWRKGPYHIHGTHIDTEWRSDWKWERVRPHLQPLKNRIVLDVGCGNGYHCWRMVGEGAKLVVGIDPSPLFVCQFFALKNFIQNPRAWVLPLGIEELPKAPGAFDTVFSMGILYHRRSPIDHLLDLKTFLRPGGEVVLETLVADGPEGWALLPKGRYAKMRNTWFIPSIQTLELWMQRCGFKQIQTVDVCTTSTQEQRSTDWMTFESLPDFLDPTDPSKTIEGYPAPKRAVVLATA
jgi:tRNA (mo5U34)-methyltransferase